jgi:hypothetical protein
MVKNLVAYAVSWISIHRTRAINQSVCPRVRFTGMIVDFKKELNLGFGYSSGVFYGTNNTYTSRTIPCIALYPCCNSTGSWEFMSLTTKKRIHHSQWQHMVTMELIVNAMNAFDEEEARLAAGTVVPADQVPSVEARDQASEEKREEQGEQVQGTATVTETELLAEPTNDDSEPVALQEEKDKEGPELVPHG